MLVAEDSQADILLIREALKHHSLDVDLVVKRDGRELLQAIDRMDAGELPCPDVVLLDLNLPRHNGTALLARMRESPVCGHIPVIIVTSSDAPKDRETAERLKASAYFRKPSDYDQFMRLGELVQRFVEPQAPSN